MSERVLVGGEVEDVYRRGDEIIISGCMRLYVDEAKGLAAALVKVADDEPGREHCGHQRGRCCICGLRPGHQGMHECGSCGIHWAIPYDPQGGRR